MEKLKVFISHASVNKDSADEVCEYLEKNGRECWIAPRNIPAGAEYGEEIIKGIEGCDVMVVVFSAASNSSQHVLREIERAVNRKIPIIAFKIEYCTVCKSMEYFLSSNQWLDASFNITEMLGPLNSSIEKIYEMKSNAEKENELAPVTTINVSKKSAPLIFGIVAVCVVALTIAVIALCDSITVNNTLNVSQSETETQQQIDFGAAGNDEKVQNNGEYSVGEYISFGRYYPTGYNSENNDGEIVWQVVEIDKTNGKMTLMSSEIIDIKPYDCAESGKFDVDFNGNKFVEEQINSYSEDELISFRGNNYWPTSDIRAWLNSSGTVEYYGIAPTDEATDEKGNSFGNQKGFLSSFTKEELDLICETETEESASDLVYLLSVEEINTYMSDSTFVLHPSATKSAAASDSTSWYKTYATAGDYLWATRSTSSFFPNKIIVIDCSEAHELFSEFDAATSGLGIRPAMTVDLKEISALQRNGEGSAAEPYSIIL